MKSEALFISAIHTLLEHQQPVLILEPTYSLITKICYPRVTKILTDIGIPFSLNKAESIIRTSYGNIMFCSASDESKIIGLETLAVYLDEFDVLPMQHAINIYHKVSARARLKSKNPAYVGQDVCQIRIATTPEGWKATHFLFKKEPLPDSELIQMSTYSNEANLPLNYISNLAAQYPSNLLKAYLMGEFCNLHQETVYDCFDRELHVVKQTAPSKTERIHVGQDFNHTQMASTCFVQRKNSEGDIVWLLIDEITQGRDTADIISKLKEKFVRNPITIYPDATASRIQTAAMSRSDHSMLRDAGFEIKVNSLNPRIKDRILCVNNAFDKGKLFISENCTSMIDALEHQAYKDGFPEKNFHDHIIDSGGYFICHALPIYTTQARYAYVRHL